MMKLALALMLQSIASIGYADELALYLMEVPPLTINGTDHKGLVGDIVFEAMRRAGYQAKLIVVPSNRALATVASPESSDILIIPLARVEDREPKFTWIAPIVKVNRSFFAIDKAVQSFDEARSTFGVVGVARGSAGVAILRAEGFAEKQIYELNQGEVGAKMLLLRRIDAWFGPIAEGRELLRITESERKIQYGVPLGATFNYLGCSKVCNPTIVGRLSMALKSMEKDGAAKTIRQKYGYPEQ